MVSELPRTGVSRDEAALARWLSSPGRRWGAKRYAQLCYPQKLRAEVRPRDLTRFFLRFSHVRTF